MKIKTIVIIVIIPIVLFGLVAVAAAAGGAGVYFSTRNNNTLSATAVNTQPLSPAAQSTHLSQQQPVEMATSASEKIQPRQTLGTDGMTLLYVPAGNFQMGSTDAQYQAGWASCLIYRYTQYTQSDCEKLTSNEKPKHTVYLDAFRIDQTEVTNAMYAKCVTTGACQAPSSSSSSTQKGYYGDSQYANFPVVYVNWNNADAYCKWAGRSLPTEAQWEKAARGTDGRTYPWGEGIDSQKANYFGKDTTQVGSFPAGASPYGALDMAGNVDEWVADWYGQAYYANSPDRNPMGPVSGTMRVLRGGAWLIDAFPLRSNNRDYLVPVTQDEYIGFRCAGSPSSTNTGGQPALPTDEVALIPTQEAVATNVSQPEMAQTPHPETPAYFQVYFKNDCDKAAQFSIHYKNLDDQWVSNGWLELQPGEFAYVADTKNTIYYYYGELIGEGSGWGGVDLNLSIDGSKKLYAFGEYTIKNADWGKAIQTFICP